MAIWNSWLWFCFPQGAIIFKTPEQDALKIALWDDIHTKPRQRCSLVNISASAGSARVITSRTESHTPTHWAAAVSETPSKRRPQASPEAENWKTRFRVIWADSQQLSAPLMNSKGGCATCKVPDRSTYRILPRKPGFVQREHWF